MKKLRYSLSVIVVLAIFSLGVFTGKASANEIDVKQKFSQGGFSTQAVVDPGGGGGH